MKISSLFAFASTLLLLALPAQAQSGTFSIDPAHAAATFEVEHLGISTTHGRFNDVAGTFSIDENNLAKAKLTVVIVTKSIDSNSKKRDEHLRGPDFFFAKRFPKMTFESTRFEKISKGKVRVYGTLKLHGVSQKTSIVLVKVGEGKDPWGGFRAGYNAAFTLKRSEFGMKYMLDGISDEVKIQIALEGVRK